MTAAAGRGGTPPLVTSCATFRTTVTAASLTGALRWGARAQRVRGVSDGIQGDTLLFDGLQQLCYLFIIWEKKNNKKKNGNKTPLLSSSQRALTRALPSVGRKRYVKRIRRGSL